MTMLLVVAGLRGQSISDTSIDHLLARVQSNSDTIYVVNFWATWCHPCVAELPIFSSERLNTLKYPTKVILVSLDFKNQVDKQLIPFIQKKGISHEVFLLNERNPNEWIDKIDKSWSGAIPATLIYQGRTKAFHEGELSVAQLLDLINQTSH